MANKVLNVDYAQMQKLADSLDEAGRRSRELWQQILDDVDELGSGPKPWKGANYKEFMAFFEGNSHVGWYFGGSPEYMGSRASWLELQGQWVRRCLQRYQGLEAELEAGVKAKLGAVASTEMRTSTI